MLFRSYSGARFGAAFLIGLTVAAAPRDALAQRLGDVHGRITGAHGPIIGARVAIETPARVAIADERGAYTLRGIPAGGYEVLVTALGYKAARRAVNVIGNESMPLDITLEQGS